MTDFNLSAGLGVSELERRDGRGSYSYPTLGVAAGLAIPVLERQSGFFRSGYLMVEAAYGRLQNGSQTLGSHEDQVGVRAGYRQTFVAGPLRFFLAPRLGVDLDFSAANFGSAREPLPHDINLTGHASIPLGIGHCFGRHPCLSFVATPFYRRSLVATEPSQALGILFGLEVSVATARTVLARDHEQLQATHHSLQAAHRAEEQRGELARAAQQRLEQELDQTRVQRDQARSVVEQLGATSRQLRTSLLAERNRSPVNRILENPISNTVVSFGTEMSRLALQDVRSHGRLRARLAMVLSPLVEHLLAHPEVRIRVHGHASLSGPAEFNRNLSLQRAQVVARYLRSRGIREGQIVSVEGHGFNPPLTYLENPSHSINQSVTFEEVRTP